MPEEPFWLNQRTHIKDGELQHDRFSNIERKDIREGRLQIQSDEILEIVRRPIIADLDRIVRMLVRVAADGFGKFNNRGAPQVNDKGDTEFIEEHIPIQQRIKVGLDLIKFLTDRNVANSDAGLSADEILGKMKHGEVPTGTAGEHAGGTGQTKPNE